jgi:hypothetical protein
MEAMLEKITYTFMQECNTNGTTGMGTDSEVLEITVESGHDSINKGGGFLVLRTTGWSINDAAELTELLVLIEKGIGSEVPK